MNKKNFAIVGLSLVPAMAFAQDAVVAQSSAAAAYWAAGLCMAIAAAVVGFAQSRAAVAALEGIGRNPSAAKNLNTPLILSLALMESIALFAFIIAIILTGK